ncbi:MAG: BLUF domain-containing protein [Janthinobacterium lividum]
MHHIVYLSQAKEPLTPPALVALLRQARLLNERQHVTGTLVYGNGQFMQLIEGEEAVIKALYERIARDPRHHQVFKLADKPIAGRRFAEWSMAFGEAPAKEFQELQGLVGYMSQAQLRHQVETSSAADGLLLDKMNRIVKAFKQP